LRTTNRFERTDRPEVKTLAEAIYNSQEVEIKTMQDKLESMGASLSEEPTAPCGDVGPSSWQNMTLI